MFAFNFFENFGERLIRGLAVCGAAFVGYLLGWGLAWLLNKALFHLPKTGRGWKALKGSLRWAGAIVAAVVAALILFGSGLGLGFGGGPNTGKGEGPAQAQPTSPAPTTEPPKPRVKEPPPRTADTAQVTLLAPPLVQAKHFYRLEPDRKPLTLEQTEQAILEQKQKAGPVPLTRVEILVYNNSPNDPRLTQQLIEWARRVGLTASLVPIDQEVP